VVRCRRHLEALMSSIPTELTPGYKVGPPLAAEIPKPPFRPKAIGSLTFFFGPIAGAFVSAVSLRRMGYQEKAGKVLRYILLVSVGLAFILALIPEGLGRIVGIGLEIGFYAVFPKIIYKEFAEWETAHPEIEPSSGWRAIGWGFLGILLYFVAIVMATLLLSSLWLLFSRKG
jgi:hypothetical protein